MRNINRFWLIAITFFSLTTSLIAQPGLEKIKEVKGILYRNVKSLKDQRPDASYKEVAVRDWNGVIWGTRQKPVKPEVAESGADQSEAARQNVYNNKAAGGEPVSNAGYGGVGATTVAPADPTVAVGKGYIIQAANATSGTQIKIWDKSTGLLVVDTKYLDIITGIPGLGDPIVLYDQIADRYVMTEFRNSAEAAAGLGNGVEGLVMAVSKTNDATGGWWVYFYPSVGNAFPDYPKFSVWTDGYYATTNDFNSSYIGSSIYAFDRASMLNGAPAADMRTFRFLTSSYTRYFTMCPVLLQGAEQSNPTTSLPPAGTGGLFAYMNDNFASGSSDSVGIIELNIDWSITGDGKYRTWASLPVSSFNGAATCVAQRGACIPQPGTTKKLESLERRVMNQPIYRNFGSYQGIVLTHFANVSSVAAMRWYELRNDGTGWSVYQQSSYAPGDGLHRWMGSVAYNKDGDIALAYNASSSSVYPGLRYTGRKAADPLNTMTVAEGVLKAGTGSATGYSRYGDYNHLVSDPSTNEFWFTAMYNTANPWSTWVSSFTLGASNPPPPVECPDTFEPNETSGAAKTISFGTAISASIKTTGDVDWFKVTTNNNATNIKVTLSDLTADYDLTLFASDGTTSRGTKSTLTNGDEVIVWNTTAKRTTYLIRVRTVAGNDAAVCYSLLAQSSSNALSAPAPIGNVALNSFEVEMMKGLKLYPNPVMSELQVQYQASTIGEVTISIHDITGRLRAQEAFSSKTGMNFYKMNTDKLNNGMYIMQISQNGNQVSKKFEVRK